MAEQEDIDQAGLAEAFANARGTTVVEPTVVETPAATETATIPTPPVETPQAKQVDTINYAEWLAEKTEGFIKDEESLKTILPKAKGYDDLETKLKDLEAKVPQFKNPESQALYEAWISGNEKAVIDYYNDKNTDYNIMSDVDIVRVAIAKEHPEWDKKGIDLEVRGKFGKQLEPIDLSTIEREDEFGKITQEYRDAVAHNERAEENLLRLKIAARDYRVQLIENQQKIELPQPTKPAQAAEATSRNPEQEAQIMQKWIKDVETEVPNLPPIKYAIDDKEVEYSYTPEQQKEFTDKMKSFHIGNFAKERGWLNEDGTTNAKALSEDVRWLLDRDKIVKSFGTQLTTAATKDTLKKIKNIPDSVGNASELNAEPGSMEEALAAARAKAGW